METFNINNEIKKFEDSDQRHLNIIAYYVKRKKLDIRSREDWVDTTKRLFRPAMRLKAKQNDQLLKAFDEAETVARKLGIKWGLETVIKQLDK